MNKYLKKSNILMNYNNSIPTTSITPKKLTTGSISTSMPLKSMIRGVSSTMDNLNVGNKISQKISNNRQMLKTASLTKLIKYLQYPFIDYNNIPKYTTLQSINPLTQLLTLTAGGLAGSLLLPSKNKRENIIRGMSRSGGITRGAGLGLLLGSGLGAGLGTLAGISIPGETKNVYLFDSHNPFRLGSKVKEFVDDVKFKRMLPILIGAAALGIPGAIYGGFRGMRAVDEYIGKPTYETDNEIKDENSESNLKKNKEKSGSFRKKAIIGSIGYGASLEAARATSKKKPIEKIKSKALYGALKGILSGIGTGVGTFGGGTLGIIGGSALGSLLGHLSGNKDTHNIKTDTDPIVSTISPSIPTSIIGLIGGGISGGLLGSGLGGYAGHRLGWTLGDYIENDTDKDDSDTDMAKSKKKN